MFWATNKFLSHFDVFQEWARTRDYSAMENPGDGVEYPDISTDIPETYQMVIVDLLEELTGLSITGYTMFFRLMTKNTPTPPHQAHHDAIMGQYTAIMYINPGEGGTSILEHKDGAVSDEVVMRDTNNYSAWKIKHMIRIKPNRMVVYNSDLIHRAEPVDGFGSSPDDGRLVLTVFFNANS